MDKLSVAMQEKIMARPTNTVLRHQNSDVNQQFTEIFKVYSRRNVPLPKSFDGRVTWKGLLTPPANQGRCGSCWAYVYNITNL